MANNNNPNSGPPHPVQPLITDPTGRAFFKRNAIVELLLDEGPLDMNTLALRPFSVEDREQFTQLIGYSLDGFSELDYVTDETIERAASRESPILAFQRWLKRLVKDNKRKMTQTEYGIAYAAFIAAHPGEGPRSTTFGSEEAKAK